MLRLARWTVWVGVCVALGACDDGGATGDVALVDAAGVDAARDGGGMDGGAIDEGVPGDAGELDGGGLDAGRLDGSEGDAGSDDPARVDVEQGRVRGRVVEGVVEFLGVPFAEPPVGERRFAAPVPAAPWDGERSATDWPPPCPQLPPQGGELLGSEDCLALNVWRPVDAVDAPVLVFIHGGGNMFGASSEINSGVRIYSGERWARRFGVVVVTIQYRLNILGYLVDAALDGEVERGAAANWGLRDQIAALAWVRDNVAAFGGDPERVLLFGESGGASSVCGLVATPAAAGLFSVAIMQSGGCGGQALDAVRGWSTEVTAAVGCDGAVDRVACLRGASVEALVRAASEGRAPDEGVAQNPAGPTVDGALLPRGPLAMMAAGEHNHAPLVFGANAMETAWPLFGIVGAGQVWDAARYEERVRAMFGPLADAVLAEYAVPDPYANHAAALIALTTDLQFVCPTRTYARAAAATQAEPVYRYLYDHPMAGASLGLRLLGAFHGAELLYQFQHIEHIDDYMATADDLAVQAGMAGLWVDFARGGAPEQVEWPAFDAASDPYLSIEAAPRAATGLRTARCDFWEALLGG